MSTPFGAPKSNNDLLSLPRGEVLGRYESYLDAQKVVDYLADHDFPVSNVSIIGCDLKSVERVTAKLSYPRVAMSGAAQGAMFGIFVGLLLSLFNEGNPLGQILSSVALGMAIWMIVGVVGYSFRRGKRDFSSSNQFLAGYYDVVVAFEQAPEARRLASSLPMSQVQAGNVTPAWAPPRQGQGPSAGSAGSAAPAAAPAPKQQDPEKPEKPAEDTGGRPGYGDLPDGRPQFGVRVAAPVQDGAESEAAPSEGAQDSERTEPAQDADGDKRD
ncbi:general stress protein [Zhihengliuella salsuginis]|uniref:General stress protein 17M-like domain-containing protein n=1 Tax=Zhihengliuella salsuginis TaxID=578222 RepID=A0ABQ3GG94_9MICC|nr:general stress protein [Zhihengliuella salsuginis]GHD03763.1 hypothetical protein GCM10008096_10220 [Zhihengliuella salsuginis]